jgi:hypothetical protein
MYCPKCGHRQATDTIKSFCTGCGFNFVEFASLLTDDEPPEGDAPLKGDELLKGDETPAEVATPSNVATPSKVERLSPRQRGLRLALLLVVIGLVLVPLAYLLRDNFLDKMIYLLVPAALLFLTGVARAAYAALLEDGEPVLSAQALRSTAAQLTPSRLKGADAPESLPPARVSLGDIIAEEREAEVATRARVAKHVTRPMRERGTDAA